MLYDEITVFETISSQTRCIFIVDEFIKNALDKFPSWFYSIAAILFLVAMIAVLWWLILGAKRFTDAIGKEDNLRKLQVALHDEHVKLQKSENLANQLVTMICNIKPFISEVYEIKSAQDPVYVIQNGNYLIQRIIDTLASDVKVTPGDKHRCGLWLLNNNTLVLNFGSAGFPPSYIRKRVLDMNHSIAGKALRKNQTIHLHDVTKDDDWVHNPDSHSVYKALICIPVRNYGVLTIDAHNPMSEEIKHIGELYSSLLDGLVEDFVTAVMFLSNRESNVQGDWKDGSQEESG